MTIHHGPDALHVILRLEGRVVRVAIPYSYSWPHVVDVRRSLEWYRR